MRRQVLRAAAAAGLATEERAVPLDELFAAEEVFLSNSLVETLPAGRLDGRPLRRGPIAERLRRAIRELEGEGEESAP